MSSGTKPGTQPQLAAHAISAGLAAASPGRRTACGRTSRARTPCRPRNSGETHEDPADRVARAARGHERAERRERDRHQGEAEAPRDARIDAALDLRQPRAVVDDAEDDRPDRAGQPSARRPTMRSSAARRVAHVPHSVRGLPLGQAQRPRSSSSFSRAVFSSSSRRVARPDERTAEPRGRAPRLDGPGEARAPPGRLEHEGAAKRHRPVVALDRRARARARARRSVQVVSTSRPRKRRTSVASLPTRSGPRRPRRDLHQARLPARVVGGVRDEGEHLLGRARDLDRVLVDGHRPTDRRPRRSCPWPRAAGRPARSGTKQSRA